MTLLNLSSIRLALFWRLWQCQTRHNRVSPKAPKEHPETIDGLIPNAPPRPQSRARFQQSSPRR